MSVTIRLAKVGRKNAPSYKIVVANTRDKNVGRFLDILGHYNPSHNPPLYSMDKDKLNEWKAKGAIVSNAVEKLNEGTYVFKPYNPHAKAEETTKPAEEAVESAETEEARAAEEAVSEEE